MRLRLTSICFVLLWASCASLSWAGSGTDSKVVLGERLYRTGIGTTGVPVQALSQGDVPLSGAQAACVSCHRPSGLGSSEGGYYVPPISGPLLFAPRKLDRLRLFPQFFHQIQPQRFTTRLHQPHMRPGYTLTTLGTVLRTGVDPAGQRLATIMPRYKLSAADLAALDAYLHTLSAHIDPGVDARQIHFATVFSANVPADEREAMLGVMRAYLKFHNLRLHEDLSRNRFSPYNRSEFVPIERAWTLTVWELKGAASTWRAQLEAHYRKDRVFALVGGRVDGSWAGASRFCDAHHIPCLFPDTDLPAWPPPKDGYTVYFDAGLPLEARVMADFIGGHDAATTRVVQLAARDAYGQEPAQVFQQDLSAHNAKLKQRLISFRGQAGLEAALRAHGNDAGTTLVIWPGADVPATVAALAAVRPRAAQIFLPTRAIAAVKADMPPALADRVRFADPYELDPASHVRSFETRAWMRTRGLKLTHPLLMFKEYYAMTLLKAALWEISNDFYRDYLLERVEDESQMDLNPGMFPHLALGPGERFAAKGAYIVAIKPGQPSGLAPVSAWITP